MSGLNNREYKELQKLKRKAGFSELNSHEVRRVEQLESKQNQEETYTAKNPNDKYNLSWFHPLGKQQTYVNDMHRYDTVLVQGSSGVGKSTAAVWCGLSLLGKGFKRVMFIKTPNEVGDDAIGFLSGNENDKLVAHFKNMKNIFLDFMSESKLETDVKKRNIVFDIPNFIQGGTFSDTFAIIDEAQNMTPATLKLLLERFDDSCKVVVLGDCKQTYSVKKRKDGFTDLVNRVCEIDNAGRKYCVEKGWSYVELPPSENRRGKRSRRITELYSE